VQLMPSRQKAAAIRVTLMDNSPTGGVTTTGQGIQFAGLSVDVGTYQSGYRVPSAEKG
jgi:hypothetical protein